MDFDLIKIIIGIFITSLFVYNPTRQWIIKVATFVLKTKKDYEKTTNQFVKDGLLSAEDLAVAEAFAVKYLLNQDDKVVDYYFKQTGRKLDSADEVAIDYIASKAFDNNPNNDKTKDDILKVWDEIKYRSARNFEQILDDETLFEDNKKDS